ncbi:hypothetical protein [Brucella anthropi]|uniref:Uncharacterized protein n=1 Tax=Brucella anthropi TaxID=529 RepID=A0A8I0NAD4_BRUAN|nr:hypothetical protein [Brucella anthropi]KAB2751754.1 hypothetical protein F9L05_01055 [Brucella anthropi]MBE0563619.1 hypothetical protein [Brucella anthropi]
MNHRRFSRVRGGPISGRLVHQQNKFTRPSIRGGTVIDLERDWLSRYRGRLCTQGAAAMRPRWRKIAAIHFRKFKTKGPFIGDWGFKLMLKRSRKKGRK